MVSVQASRAAGEAEARPRRRGVGRELQGPQHRPHRDQGVRLRVRVQRPLQHSLHPEHSGPQTVSG